MKFAIEAFLLEGSNVVFMDKSHLNNKEVLNFKDVTIFLSDEEIEKLHKRMKEEREDRNIISDF